MRMSRYSLAQAPGTTTWLNSKSTGAVQLSVLASARRNFAYAGNGHEDPAVFRLQPALGFHVSSTVMVCEQMAVLPFLSATR